MANTILAEVINRIINDKIFNKFVYYKDVDDKDILSLDDVENPVEKLYNNNIWLHRRPKKILHEEDVNVFLTLEDMRSQNTSNKNIKTMNFKAGILVHEDCLLTANGSRDIVLLERLMFLIENDSFFKSLGECRVYKVNHLFGLGIEYSGFEVYFSIDGIREREI
jgi:hypothetical protein